MRKECGQVNWTVGLFLILFVAVLLLATVGTERLRAVSLYAEDALTASNLASMLVDLEEYGISHRVLVVNPEEAYRQYQKALKENLRLNGEWLGVNGSIIAGPVWVDKYIVYNVDGNKVQIYSFGKNGATVGEGNIGTVRSPNGAVIDHTSVYSEISFDVEVVPGINVRACKGKLADVVSGRE